MLNKKVLFGCIISICLSLLYVNCLFAGFPNLKLPYSGGEKWKTSCAYNGIGGSDCQKTHVGADCYALDFNWGLVDADCGRPAVAVASGTVIVSDYSVNKEGWGYGNRVKIDHGDGYSSLYAHLESKSVQVGDVVAQGQEIGKVGHSGTNSCHLHFAFYRVVDGVKTACKPEPMSGHEDFKSGDSYLSDNYFTPATNFTFPAHSSQGWTPGNNTSIPEQTQSDLNTLMFLVQGTNPGVESPSFPDGIDTDQFKKLKFSARVDGSGYNEQGYVYVKDETGSWNNEVYFGSVFRYKYYEYDVDLSSLRASLPIRQFSIEMTRSASNEHWIFDWIKLISSYNHWEFKDSPQGWTLYDADSENIYANEYWKIDPTGNDPQIVSPYFEIDTSVYNSLDIRFSEKGPEQSEGEEPITDTLCVFYDFGSNFNSSNQATKSIIRNNTQAIYTFSLPNNRTLQRLRIDPIACGNDTEDDIVFLDYVRFYNSSSGSGGDFDSYSDDSTEPEPEPIATPTSFTFTDPVFCTYVDPEAGYSPVNEKDIFYEGDAVIFWSKVENISGSVGIRVEFVMPDKSIYSTRNWDNITGSKKFATLILFVPECGECYPELKWEGEWTVRVYLTNSIFLAKVKLEVFN
jgi:hypothetical protein